MLREFTCIICPNGCDLTAVVENDQVLSVDGATCARGNEYVRQEITAPMRNIATSILVRDGQFPLASVRLTKPIPKSKIFATMEEIKKVRLTAPVHIGDVVIRNVLGLGSDVIVTKNVDRI